MSCLVFTKRRLWSRVLDIETGKTLDEGTTAFDALADLHSGLVHLRRLSQAMRIRGTTVMHSRRLEQIGQGEASATSIAGISTAPDSPYRVAIHRNTVASKLEEQLSELRSDLE